MPSNFAFSPSLPAQKQTVPTTGARYPLSAWPAPEGGSVMISVRGANDVFFAFGDVTATCTEATGQAAFARTQTVWSVPNGASYVYMLALNAATDVQIAQGQGV